MASAVLLAALLVLLAEEFYRLLDGVLIDDAGAFNDKLREWEDYYNYQ